MPETSDILSEDIENVELLISWLVIQQSAVPALEALVPSVQKMYALAKAQLKEETKLPTGEDGQPIVKPL